MPEERRRCVLVQIFKVKGDVQSFGNYRGIKSMSRVMKLRGNSRSSTSEHLRAAAWFHSKEESSRCNISVEVAEKY